MTQLETSPTQLLRDRFHALIEEADDARLEDMYEAAWEASQTPELEQFANSLADIKAGRVVSMEELRATIAEWKREG